MRLTWHNYRYFPYERDLARREVVGLLEPQKIAETLDGLEIVGASNHAMAERLTYFSGFSTSESVKQTLQHRFESVTRSSPTRQATRYSVHGLHEYKGKFNPQVAKAILNIFGLQPGHRVLDPFCGSGTALVECSHIGIEGVGIDINPLAVFVSNAKLRALTIPAYELREVFSALWKRLNHTEYVSRSMDESDRIRYLGSWFNQDILRSIEMVRDGIDELADYTAPVFYAIASNLLRGYSLQDPADLRIRRRKSPLPAIPFTDAFLSACSIAITNIQTAQNLLGASQIQSSAILGDVSSFNHSDRIDLFDAAVTSPPYAMALPYIDTHRLSLAWLGLIEPRQIRSLETKLIGSREIRGGDRSQTTLDMWHNSAGLPDAEAAFCCRLQDAVGESDGFRRRAVPALLYRYFVSMQHSFHTVRELLRPHAPFALIVGRNHSVLGGERFEIDTPSHLANIASALDWKVEELISLQTYQRYGYHMNNAVRSETLMILRNS